MTYDFVATTVIAAWPEQHDDGTPGFAVRYPDGHRSWCPEDEFRRTARPLSPEEQALVQTYAAKYPASAEPDPTSDLPIRQLHDSDSTEGLFDPEDEYPTEA